MRMRTRSVKPHEQKRIGHVSLVGAGPGDPGLLTRRALACLRRADLVLYDALVDPRVVGLARRAQRFFVGKRAGRHALSQQEIHAIMIGAAARGRRVARLKGGDPFVFGRGGEEAQALKDAGIPFDIVPGVTSAIAVPGSAGIPVTHRGLATSFFVASGHSVRAFSEAVDGLTADSTTVVILMGFARRAALARAMLDRRWNGATPAAIVADGTLPGGEVWRGTLADLAAGEGTIGSDAPALILVGRVAALDLNSTVRETAAVSTGDPSRLRVTRSR